MLESGLVFKGVFESSAYGPPQGGTISPLLGNFVLDGLEDTLKSSLDSIIQKDNKKVLIGLKPVICRFADDIIIVSRSRNLIKTKIKPKLLEFLQERGLTISEQRSSLFKIKDKPLIFLGYMFAYKYYRSRYRLSMFPAPGRALGIRHKIRKAFKKSQNSTAYELIAQLNPVIKGWCNYFSLSQSYTTLRTLEQFIYRRCWLWAIKKHRKWGKRKIAETYFKYSVKGRRWSFSGQTLKLSRYSEKPGGKRIYLHKPTNCV